MDDTTEAKEKIGPKGFRAFDSSDQIAVMRSLSIPSAAWLVGLSAQTFRNKLVEFGPEPNGRYDASKLVKLIRDKCSLSESDEDAAKVKLLQEKARIQELKRIEMEGNLVDVSLLRDQLSEIVRHLRTVGEGLKRRYGMDAVNLLNRGLNECLRVVAQLDGGQHTINRMDHPGGDNASPENAD